MKLLILAAAVLPFPAMLIGLRLRERARRARIEALLLKDVFEVWRESWRDEDSGSSGSSSSQVNGSGSSSMAARHGNLLASLEKRPLHQLFERCR